MRSVVALHRWAGHERAGAATPFLILLAETLGQVPLLVADENTEDQIHEERNRQAKDVILG